MTRRRARQMRRETYDPFTRKRRVAARARSDRRIEKRSAA